MIVIIFWKIKIFNKNSSLFRYYSVVVTIPVGSIIVPNSRTLNCQLFFLTKPKQKEQNNWVRSCGKKRVCNGKPAWDFKKNTIETPLFLNIKIYLAFDY